MNYVELLKQNQLKATPQRLKIVEVLYMKGHLNIDDIYAVLKSSFPSISLATIYKNINSMIEISFLSEVKIPKQKSVYELTKAEHAHVICSKCNEILDIELDTSDIVTQASKLSHYNLEKSAIIFNGVCLECRSKE